MPRRGPWLTSLLLALTAGTLGCGPRPGPERPGEGPARSPVAPEPSEALTAALTEARAGVEDEELAQLLVDHWSHALDRQPVFATQLGVHDHDHRLANASLEERELARTHRAELLRRARAIDASRLSATDRVSLTLFIEELEVDTDADICAYGEWSMSPRDNPVAEMNLLPELSRFQSGRSCAPSGRASPSAGPRSSG